MRIGKNRGDWAGGAAILVTSMRTRLNARTNRRRIEGFFK